MSSAEIPYSFYCISSELENNTLYYDDTNTLVLPSQNYTPDEVITKMNADTGFNAIFSASYNRFTNKITITNNTGSSHIINWTKSNINKVLGFGSKTSDETIAGSGTTISPDMLNLASVHSIMVHSNLSQANVLSTRSGNSTILQKISIDVNAYEIIYLNMDDWRTTNISHQPVVDRLRFRLTDQNNITLQLNNLNYEFSIIFNIYPRYTNKIQIQNAINDKRDRNSPIYQRQNIITQPPSILPNIQTPISREEPIGIDSTHPIVGQSEIEHDTKSIILDNLLNLQTE